MVAAIRASVVADLADALDWHGGVAAPLYWHGGWALSCWYEVLILLTLMGSPANRAVGMDTMPWPHEARC